MLSICFYAYVKLSKYQKNPQRIEQIKPFVNQYNWKGIHFPPQSKDWKKFESNNKPIALDIFYVPHNTKKIWYAYKLKYNSTDKKQVILLMITDNKKRHYLAVKSLPALFREITGNNHGDFYCLNRFRAYTTRNRPERHKNIKTYVKIMIIAV